MAWTAQKLEEETQNSKNILTNDQFSYVCELFLADFDLWL